MKKVICQSNSSANTLKCGQNIKLDNLICLWGDLGSGKTTLVKGLAKTLGLKNTITSPSFLIFKVYKTKHKKFKRLVHVDLYRLEKNINFSKLGLEEYFNDPYTLVVIDHLISDQAYHKINNICRSQQHILPAHYTYMPYYVV